MKKVIPFLCLLSLVMCACTHQKSPETDSAFTYDAVYHTGDFSFKCTVKLSGGTVFVTVNSTNAAGLTVSCDGKNVTFTRGKMIKTLPKESVDATNPARLLWEVFDSFDGTGSETTLGHADVDFDTHGGISRIAVADITVVTQQGTYNIL